MCTIDPRTLLDPQCRQLGATLLEAGLRAADPMTMTLDQARQAAELWHAAQASGAPAMAETRDLTIAGPHGTIPLRLYHPHAAMAAPVVAYFHGGGFVLNSLDTHDETMRRLAAATGAVICGIDYRLAPEHRFPVQWDEAARTVAWLLDEAGAHGVDGTRVAVCGDSAGANLALSALLVHRQRVKAGLLFYGMYRADFDTPSHQLYGGGALALSSRRMRWYWRQWAPAEPAQGDPRAQPLLADLNGLPPVDLVGAGVDCLLDDTRRLAARLVTAGIDHTLTVWPSLPHSFLPMAGHVKAAMAALDHGAQALAARL